MFKSAQVLASTTLLCCVLALSGCGASQAGQEAEGTSAQPSASASVKPGTIRVASDGATPSVTPGSITVVNSPRRRTTALPLSTPSLLPTPRLTSRSRTLTLILLSPPTRVPSRTSQTTLQILSRIHRRAQTRLHSPVLTLRVAPRVLRARRILPILRTPRVPRRSPLIPPATLLLRARPSAIWMT